MRILPVGAGAAGTALARIAARRPFAELVIADYDPARAQQRAAAARDGYQAVLPDARDEAAVAGLLAGHRCDVLLNATDPRLVMPLFRAALQAGTGYLDMAMSLSYPHPDDPYRQTGVKLGDDQFAMAPEREQPGRLALAGIGVKPGVSDVFARDAAGEPFRGVRGAHRRPPLTGQRRPGRDQVSERIWLSSLVVFAAGSAWRQSCSMTSR
jgi:saccharopine dehydrogenase-like NADP-dependent oxidoreductase